MTYFTLIQSATLGLAKVFVKVSKGAASARRIQEVLLAPEQQRQTAPLPAGGGFLGMDRVTFSYQGAKPGCGGRRPSSCAKAGCWESWGPPAAARAH